MPKYRVLKKSFINHSLHEEGAVIDFDGTPGDNLEAIDEEAKEATSGASNANADSLERQQAAARGVDVPPVDEVLA
jgi:hypothetical protein